MSSCISILGSTGSIGRQTLDVVDKLGLRVAALTANRDVDRLEAQCRKYRPKLAVMMDEAAYKELKARLSDMNITVVLGLEGLITAASLPEADTVVTAVSGMVGLKPTLAAIREKKRIALANKETLVCAGELVMEQAKTYGAEIIPVDSEHSAIFQCLMGNRGKTQIKRLILTCSGGPFYGLSRAELTEKKKADALRHPNWKMGAKITIDCATLMNKGLEIIEAMRLYDLPKGESAMLSVLHIENIAVIEQAEILFEGGFNVLTGETGAGKSIVIDAISAILGERTYRDVIRTGASRAFVSAIFTKIPECSWFSENQVEFDPLELQVQREIYADGKNVCRVNGRPVSVAALKKLGARLINIHGQHDSQQLFDEENHLTYLDTFARDEKELEDYRAAFDALQSVRREIQKLSMDESEKLRLLESLQYQIEEIRAANLTPGEEEQLKERRKVLQNAEKLSDALRAADEALYGGDSSDGAAGLMSNAEHALSRVNNISADMEALYQKISDLMYSVQDAADELRAMRDDLSYSEGELEQIEERLDTIHKLKRKYGASVEDVLTYLSKSEARLNEIEFASDRIEQLQKKQDKLQKEAVRLGEILRKRRQEAAQQMQTQICDELRQLDMPKIRFVCEFTPQEPAENGLDRVRFLMSANVGEALKPLSKVASGGELARIMLAMKQVLAQQDGVPTLIFDEVDAGVSGRAAQKVALKLWAVSKGRQVLCVTHLPQIAARADAEFTVEKCVEHERTYTSVLHLDDSGRRQELARLIGGSMITETTLAGAAELLRLADEAKRGI